MRAGEASCERGQRSAVCPVVRHTSNIEPDFARVAATRAVCARPSFIRMDWSQEPASNDFFAGRPIGTSARPETSRGTHRGTPRVAMEGIEGGLKVGSFRLPLGLTPC